MASHSIETQWMGQMQFNALVNGHTIVMDAPEKSGGADLGPIPKPFILTSLSGCTGMDIVALLKKQNKVVKDLDIQVIGELSKQVPIEYVSIHLVYIFTGEADIMNDALQAVTDSQEKFCGVSHMLKKAIPVTWEVIYNGTIIFNNKAHEEISAQ